jgi:hypothetical protein
MLNIGDLLNEITKDINPIIKNIINKNKISLIKIIDTSYFFQLITIGLM